MNEQHVEIEKGSDVTYYQDCSGVFMFQPRETLLKVGFFNTEYPVNGLEHVGYSKRACKSLEYEHYLCLNDTSKYIYSFDLQGKGHWKVWHKSVINPDDRIFASKANAEVLEREMNGDNFIQLK